MGFLTRSMNCAILTFSLVFSTHCAVLIEIQVSADKVTYTDSKEAPGEMFLDHMSQRFSMAVPR